MMTQEQFVSQVIEFQSAHGRHDLPWQQPATPYRVLVSEIMLQQTQVKTVIPYFMRWMESFPSVEALGNASEEDVMFHWQGLGYYRRARNLQKAAQYIVNELSGEFPTELKEIERIPGVGRYTAGAIRSFAFDQWGPIVDGNVRRLFCRLFEIEGVPTQSKVDKKIWQLSEDLTPNENNRQFAQGLLDIGSQVCKPKAPLCEACPFENKCAAKASGRQLELPTKKPKKTTPVKSYHFSVSLNNDYIELEKRPPVGIWSSLWMLPEIASEPERGKPIYQFSHTFTHFKMKGHVWLSTDKETSYTTNEGANIESCSLASVEKLGIPAPLKKELKHILEAAKTELNR